MADNKTVDNGVLTDIEVATDEVTYSGDTLRNVQLIRPVHVIGAEGSKTVVDIYRAEDSGHTTADPLMPIAAVRNDADADMTGGDTRYASMSVDIGGNQNVRPRPHVQRQQLTSAGLTNAVYAAGEMLGNQFTLTGMARKSGGGGYITGISLVDEVDVIGAVDVIFFVQSVTQAADNAAASWSDADMLHCLGVVNLATAYDLALNRIAVSGPIRFPYVCAATSLFFGLITRSANGAIAAATNIKVTVTYEPS